MGMDIFCTNCGAKLNEGAKFCASCGRFQAVVQQAQPAYQAPKIQQAQPAQDRQYIQHDNQQYVSSNSAAPKKKSRLLLILGLSGAGVVAIVVTIILIVNGVLGVLRDTAALDLYEIGNDEVPSVKFILGEERTVIGVSSSSNSDGMKERVIVYAAKTDVSTNDDMIRYATALCDDYGFYRINDNDFSGETGTDFRFGKESVDKGNLIIVCIDYDISGYTITLIRDEGTMIYPSYVGLWRFEAVDGVALFYLKPGGDLRSEGHFTDGSSSIITGKYKVLGNYLYISKLVVDGEQRGDSTVYINVNGDIATLGSVVYNRVPDHRIEAVLANPIAPYTP